MKHERFYFFNADDGAGEGGTPAATVETVEAPKYTDKQLNDLIAKNTGKETAKATAELLKSAGVASVEELQELAKLRASQMTETEKANARIKELEESANKAQENANLAIAKAEALSKGVPADKADKVTKLALSGVYEGDTVSDKIAAVLAEFPEYVKPNGGQSFGGQTEQQAVSKDESLKQQARRIAGLPEKK